MNQQFAYLSCFSFFSSSLFLKTILKNTYRYLYLHFFLNIFSIHVEQRLFSSRSAAFCQTSCRIFSFLLIYGQTSSRHIRPDSTYLVSCIPRYSRYRYFHIIRYLHHDIKDNFNFISVRCGMKKSPTLGGAGETCQLLCCTA